ncbi:MAG: DUF4835 family protein [Chitinophagaceae bacterium]
MRKFFFTLVFLLSIAAVNAQELQARVTIVSSQISSQVDKKIFQTLQTALNNFLNNRKWNR